MDTQILTTDQFYIRVCSHISKIYKDISAEDFANQLFDLFEGIKPAEPMIGRSISNAN